MVALVEGLREHPKAKFCCVLSDNLHAEGISKAENLGLPVHVVERSLYPNKFDFEQQIIRCLNIYQPQFIVLAGFMQLLSANFIRQYPRILNIHPSLLPKYPGLNTHQQALDNQDRQVGATVHWVNEIMDGGLIIEQCRINVQTDDTAHSLSRRVLKEEHKLYPKVLTHVLNTLS